MIKNKNDKKIQEFSKFEILKNCPKSTTILLKESTTDLTTIIYIDKVTRTSIIPENLRNLKISKIKKISKDFILLTIPTLHTSPPSNPMSSEKLEESDPPINKNELYILSEKHTPYPFITSETPPNISKLSSETTSSQYLLQIIPKKSSTTTTTSPIYFEYSSKSGKASLTQPPEYNTSKASNQLKAVSDLFEEDSPCIHAHHKDSPQLNYRYLADSGHKISVWSFHCFPGSIMYRFGVAHPPRALTPSIMAIVF